MEVGGGGGKGWGGTILQEGGSRLCIIAQWEVIELI
jgi:hypothetical protein